MSEPASSPRTQEIVPAAIIRQTPEKDEKGRFVTGNIGGGRDKGSRNKLGEAFIADMYEDWKHHGASAIERTREEKPDAYLKVIASILPKEISVKQLDNLSDDELISRLRELERIVAPFLATHVEGEIIDGVQSRVQ